MSAPGLTALADVVRSDTAGFLSRSVERQNLPVSKLTSLNTPKITVVPMTGTWARETREDAARTYGIAIGIEQRIDAVPSVGALTEDELIALAESIGNWWINDKVDPTGLDVSVVSAALNADEPFDAETLREECVFRVIVTLTLRSM